jgi:hypothetical protein
MIGAAEHRRLREALAAAHTPRGVYAAIADVCAQRIGYILLTLLIISRDGTWVKRVWSSHPQDYPIGERRHFTANDAAATAFREGKPFLADDHTALRENFPDAYKTIQRLGIDWGANIPVVGLAQPIGKITLSDAHSRWRPDVMDALAELTPYLLMPFIADRAVLEASARR